MHAVRSRAVEVDGRGRKVGLEEATEGARKKMRMDPEERPHRFGSAPLTEIWEMGYRNLWDLQHPFQCVPGSFDRECLITVFAFAVLGT